MKNECPGYGMKSTPDVIDLTQDDDTLIHSQRIFSGEQLVEVFPVNHGVMKHTYQVIAHLNSVAVTYLLHQKMLKNFLLSHIVIQRTFQLKLVVLSL